MRNTRQGTSTLEEGDNVTMQQLMETIRAFQKTVAASKANQDRILVEVQAKQTVGSISVKVQEGRGELKL